MEISLKGGEVVPVTSDMMFKAILMNTQQLYKVIYQIQTRIIYQIIQHLRILKQGILGVSEKRKVTDLIVDINKLTEMNQGIRQEK